MTFIIQNFGPNLARLRIEKGVSQPQLAEDLGIGKQSISDYETQKSYPTFTNLDKIEEYFKQINCARINIEVFGPNKRGLEFYGKNDYIVRDMIVSKRLRE